MKKEKIYTYCLDSNGVLVALYRLHKYMDNYVEVSIYVFPQFLYMLNTVFVNFRVKYMFNHMIDSTELLPNFFFEPLNLSPYEIEFYKSFNNYDTNNQKIKL